MTTEQEGVLDLRDAIIELYLAIKIRSTDEVSSFALCFLVKTNKISSFSIAGPNRWRSPRGWKDETREIERLPSPRIRPHLHRNHYESQNWGPRKGVQQSKPIWEGQLGQQLWRFNNVGSIKQSNPAKYERCYSSNDGNSGEFQVARQAEPQNQHRLHHGPLNEVREVDPEVGVRRPRPHQGKCLQVSPVIVL